MYMGVIYARFSTKSFNPAPTSSVAVSVTAGSHPRTVAERGEGGGDGRKERA